MNNPESRFLQFGRRVQPLLREPADPQLAAAFVVFNAAGLLVVLVILLAGNAGLSLAIGFGLALIEILNIARQTIRLKVPVCAMVALIGPVGIFLRALVH